MFVVPWVHSLSPGGCPACPFVCAARPRAHSLDAPGIQQHSASHPGPLLWCFVEASAPSIPMRSGPWTFGSGHLSSSVKHARALDDWRYTASYRNHLIYPHILTCQH